jgi:hypothetical protein
LRPYLASYQRTKRLVENPEASTAKAVSADLSGKLLTVTNSLRIAVSAGLARERFTLLKCGLLYPEQ